VEARYKAGEFAGLEISMALRESKYAVQRTMVVARRLRADTPDAWDAWLAGDITFDKAERISRTLGRLVRDNSKALLNAVVVDVAVCKTGELLGRWLNQFVARVEPDEQDERIGRSLADRYVSVRPDLDGVSVLSAALSSMDAASIDRVLTAIAAVADPSDTRTMQQRRADALVDVLLGRISNGCHTRWDGVDNNGFEEDGFEDNDFDVERGDGEVAAEGWFGASVSDREPLPDHREGGNDDVPDTTAGAEDSDAVAVPDDVSTETDTTAAEGCASVVGDNAGNATVTYATGAVDDFDLDDDRDADDNGHDDNHRDNHDVDESEADSDTENDVDIDDWDLPASAFRPDPPRGDNRTLIAPPTGAAPDVSASGTPTGVHQCTCGGRPLVPAAGVQIRPVQVNIGIIISAASLLGFTNTPGQLADRSALIPADTIRDLAAQPGTLFHRLVTDTSGNLLEVNELGRFPSKKLALAVTYRDGVCNADTCHTSAFRCDLDHVVPVPEGPTTAINLKDRCRKHHRAKTHAGHQTERTGPHTTKWTTPSGHIYVSHDDPLPVEEFPVAESPAENCDPPVEQ